MCPKKQMKVCHAFYFYFEKNRDIRVTIKWTKETRGRFLKGLKFWEHDTNQVANFSLHFTLLNKNVASGPHSKSWFV